MVSHICGLDSVAETTASLPEIRAGKILCYTHIDLPLTAISDFEKLGETDPLFKKLRDSVSKRNGLWNAEAERLLLSGLNAT